MSERGTTRGAAPTGEDGGRGRGRGGRGRGEGRGGRGRGGKDGEKKEWVPVTKLGRLVKAGKIKSLEEIYLFSIAIKEADIIDHFLEKDLKDEVVQLSPVQKQTPSGQRTRFRAFVLVGDGKGHVGIGQKVAGEVANAIRGALIDAKLSIVPTRMGWWGARFGAAHTVPCKVTGKCGSVTFRVIPAPKGTGLVAAKTPKKLLTAAGYVDCYTESRGKTKTRGNFAKAAFKAISKTYSYLSPDLWAQHKFVKSPLQEYSDFLRDAKKSGGAKKTDY
jgi:small subunit ribosomal protein S2e